jgi:hypothetical protein
MSSGLFARWEGIPMDNMNPHNLDELKLPSPRIPQWRPPDMGPNDLPRYRAGRISFIVFVILVLVIVIGVVLLARDVGS